MSNSTRHFTTIIMYEAYYNKTIKFTKPETNLFLET